MMWFYQMSQGSWSPGNYRLDVWERERWHWPVGRKVGADDPPGGDTIVFFYAPSGGDEAGFFGWGVVLEWNDPTLYFRATPPSDQLKMFPWWDDEAKKVADGIRGKMKQGTLWPVPDEFVPRIGAGIHRWLANPDS